MLSVLFTAPLVLLVLLPFAAAAYAACAVMGHVQNYPKASKALYDHVFLPVFVGPDKSAAMAKAADEPEFES